MAASIIGALRAVLGLDTAQFEQGADRASAKTGVLKSALMEGAAALAEFVAPAALATAGVAALAKGMEMARASLDFADELDATSTKIGITAESLQTLRFAAQDADIDASTFDGALQSLNATLGALQSGIGDGKIRKAFEALGIPQSQIDGMRDASDLLPVLADRIAKAGSQAEQVQIAKKLGVEDLLPLLQRGSAAIKALEGDARSLGVVVSNEVTARMAEMSREVEIADQRMSVASNTVGSILAPAFLTLKKATAEALLGLAEFMDGFKAVENRADQSLIRVRDNAYASMSRLLQGPYFKDGAWLSAIAKIDYDRAKKTYDEAQAEIEKRLKDNRAFSSSSARPASVASTSSDGGLSPAAKASARKQGSEWADLFGQARANREAYNERKALSDRINGSTIGDVIATEADRLKISEPIANAVEDGVGDGLIAARRTAYDTYRETFASAIDAGLRGGSKGVLDWFGWQLSRSISDMLAEMGASAATGGGWLGKAFTSIGGLLGIGKNADGTTNWRGGMTWVGERGPELLTLPRGSAITPAHLVDTGGGGGLLVSVTPSPLFDVSVRRVSREEAQSAGVQAVQASTGLAQEKQARAAFSRIR